MTKQFNVRLPDYSRNQLEEILTTTGMTIAQAMVMLIDRGHREIVVVGAPSPEEYEKYVDKLIEAGDAFACRDRSQPQPPA